MVNYITPLIILPERCHILCQDEVLKCNNVLELAGQRENRDNGAKLSVAHEGDFCIGDFGSGPAGELDQLTRPHQNFRTTFHLLSEASSGFPARAHARGRPADYLSPTWDLTA